MIKLKIMNNQKESVWKISTFNIIDKFKIYILNNPI